MADILADLRTLLLAQSSITAIVGDRGVYLDAAEQDPEVKRYIVFTVMETEGNTSLDGGTDDLQFVTLDIDCYETTALRARTLCKLVRDLLKDFSGATGGTESIAAVLVNDQLSDVVWPSNGQGKPKYMETLDLTIQFNPV